MTSKNEAKTTIILETQKRSEKILDQENSKKNLRRLKNARYMREEYKTRKKRLNVTLEHSDFKRVEQEAQKTGLTPTAFLRESVFSYLENCRIPSKEKEDKFFEMVYLLRNMACNINQIARQANTIQKLSLKGFMKTRTNLKTLEIIAEAFIKEF